MKKSSILNKVIIFIIIFMAAIIFHNKSVLAVEWITNIPSSGNSSNEGKTEATFDQDKTYQIIGNTVKGAFTFGNTDNDVKFNLVRNKYTYCLQHDVETYRTSGRNYTVSAFIKIEGATAEVYTSKGGGPKTYTNNKNAIMAYILASSNCSYNDIIDQGKDDTPAYGYGNKDTDPVGYGTRQALVWYHTWNKGWLSSLNLGEYGSTNRDPHRVMYNSYMNDYFNDYANNLETQNTVYGAYIWILSANDGTQNYMIARPTVVTSLKIKKVDAYSGNEIPGAKFVIKKNTNRTDDFYKNATTWTTYANSTGISDNETISGLDGGKYKIYEYQAPSGYRLSDQVGHESYESYPVTTSSGSTRNILYCGEYTLTKGKTNEILIVNFKQEDVLGTINIIKEDSENTGIKLKDARFVIRKASSVKEDANFYKNGEDGPEWTKYVNSTGFKTNDNGIATISGIPYGKYEIYEYKAPASEGYSLGYQEGDRLEVTKSDGSKGNIVLCKTVTLSNSDSARTVTIHIKNQKFGSIKIIKEDSRNSAKLQGAKFVIQNTAGNFYNGTTKEWTTYANSTKYTTNENGEKTITRLPFGTYKIYECLAPEGYNLYDQKGTRLNVTTSNNTKKDIVLCKTVTLSDSNNRRNVEIDIENTKIAKLTVMKKDEKTGKFLNGMKFRVEVGSGNYLTGDENGWGTTKTFSKAAEFTIDDANKGKTLNNLEKNKTYTIWETVSPNNDIYPLSLQKGYVDGKGVKVGSQTITDYTEFTMTAKNTQLSNIIVKKKIKAQDGTENYTTGMKFKIEVGESSNKYLKGSEGNWTYTASASDARVFEILDKNGLPINGLSIEHKYVVWETATPDEFKYPLSLQTGYVDGKGVPVGKTVTFTKGGQTATRETTNEEKLSNLKIYKEDEETREKLNVGFKIQTRVTENGKTTDYWLRQNNDGTYNYKVAEENNATVFRTDDPVGTKEIKDLSRGVQYKVWETAAANSNYPAPTSQENNKTVNRKALSNWITLPETVTVKEETYKNTPKKGNLEVTKIDEDTDKPLKIGIKIELDNGKWLGEKSGKYTYDNDFANAKKYDTDVSTGMVKIENLPLSKKYRIWEVEVASDEYVLADQDNYEQIGNTGNYAVNLSKGQTGADINGWITLKDNDTIKVEGKNNKSVLISGYVWVDRDTKGDGSNYDSLYIKNDDTLLEGVDVYLYKKSETGNPVDSAKTDKEGKYTFKTKVKYNELDKYYVEFDYSNGVGIDSKYYIPVVYNETAPNGSRALAASKYDEDDAKFLENTERKASTYAGNNNDHDNKYGLKGIAQRHYNQATNTIENVNLGIRKIYEPDYSIVEDLRCVVIKLNNYQYVYGYGEKDRTGLPTIQVENVEKKVYSRPISVTDVFHLDKNPENGIAVYAIYNINITNNEKLNEEYINIYVEDKLHITSLTNTFDSDRYELNKDKILDKNAQGLLDPNTTNNLKNEIDAINNDIGNWNNDGEGTVKYNSNDIEVGKSSSVRKYVQFKVNPLEITRLLSNPNEVNVEDEQTTAHTKGYHSYTRNEYAWENLPNIPTMKTRKSIEKTKEDEAPYLKFTLGEERKVTGTVFEDKVISNNEEALGNGKYDNGENKVNAVGVVLVDKDGNPIKRYEKKEDLSYKETQDIIKSQADGTYTIPGITPGDYYLKFIYDNNSSINGNQVNVKDYKSTIITAEAVKDALKKELAVPKQNYNHEWYKDLGNDSTFSVAADDLEERIKVNNEGQTSISAKSPQIDITIENATGTVKGLMDSLNSEYTFGGFYFGIIKQPEQKVEIDKKVTNIILSNDPNIIVQGNPKDNIEGVIDRSEKNDYTEIVTDEANIYNSKIELTYEITVKNTSDKNYYETDETHAGVYYLYGEYDNSYSKEYRINVEEVTDLYDYALTYLGTETDDTNMQTKDKPFNYSDDAIKAIIDGHENFNQNDYDENENALIINGWGEIKRNESKSVKLKFNKQLSTEEGDTYIINGTKVSKATLKLEGANQTSVLYSKPVDLGEPAYAETTIHPPTGGSQDYNARIIVFSLIGILSVMAIGLGIVVLKKNKLKINYLDK